METMLLAFFPKIIYLAADWISQLLLFHQSSLEFLDLNLDGLLVVFGPLMKEV